LLARIVLRDGMTTAWS